MTFKQSEKAELRRRGVDANTINEYQGSQSKIVKLVRLSTKPQEQLYLEQNQCLVALSRHTEQFYYYTPVITDTMSGLVTEVIDPAMIEKHRFKLSGGALYGFAERILVDGVSSVVVNGLSSHLADIVGCSNVNPASVESTNTHSNVVDGTRTLILPITLPRISMRPKVTDPLLVLQDWYDSCLPGVSCFDNSNDAYLVDNSALNLHFPGMSIVRLPVIIDNCYDTMMPLLRTAISLARKQSMSEVLLALFKQNYNVPDLTGVVDYELVIVDVVDNFVNSYIPEANFSLLNRLKDEPVYPSSELIQDWLNDQPDSVLGLIDTEITSLHETDLTEYSLTIKKLPKPPLTISDCSVYSSLQTILAHSKTINSLFCPVFKQLRNRLIALLSPKFNIFTDRSPGDFECLLANKFDLNELLRSQSYELDISKFDKSQGLLILLIEIRLYMLLGMPSYLAQLWFNAHENTRLIDRYNKIKCYLKYKCKSGDASTFFGNTLVTMFVLAVAINMHTVYYGVFAGDDSTIFSFNSFECALDKLGYIFNLETKLLIYKNPYFCSKFLVITPDRVYFLPDPLKLVSKLGRKDLKNFEHIEEYRVSLCDLIEPYADPFTALVLSDAVYERYGGYSDLTIVLASLYKVINDPVAFKLLYELPEGKICLDPSRPKLN